MRLLKFLKESIHDKGLFKSIWTVGNPGAGKSYVLSQVGFGSIQPKIVNLDRWTEFFGKYDSRIFSLTISHLFQYVNSMLPLFVDGTGANVSKTIKQEKILKSIGYDTGCIFVKTSLETSLQRNAQRKRKVPEDVIEKLYQQMESVKSIYKNHFKFFIEVNNDYGELTDKVILDCFKKVQTFYVKPLENPIGIQNIKELEESGKLYLTDLPQFSNLQSTLDKWWE